MQVRIIKSKIKTITSVAKPEAKKYMIIDIHRKAVKGGIFASVSARAIYDNLDENEMEILDYSNPKVAYEIPTPNLMNKKISYSDLSLLEQEISIPEEITSINERCKYFDLMATIHFMVNDEGGPMFGLEASNWEIINIDEDI